MKRLQLLNGLLASLFAMTAFAQSNGPVQVSPAVQHDTLHSLRDVMPRPNQGHAYPARPLPLLAGPGNQTDGAVQDFAKLSLYAPTFISSVDGVGTGFVGPQGAFTVNSAPPDTNGAVGATQYVQIVNQSFAVFDKTTKTALYGPVASNTLWTGFTGPCEADNDGDAVVVYDKAAKRWVITQFAVAATPYLQCVAVSQTSDAMGAYNRYAFSYGSVFPDYPKIGVWPDAYYITFNMFTSTFVGSQLCAYDRTAMLSGALATQQCFQLTNSFGGVLPADLDGSTTPPAGSPNYLLNFGTNSLNLWKFHVDWATPANTTLSAPTNIPVAAFTAACGGGACVAQSGTKQVLDSLGDRLMFRLAYRNFGDHESLVVNHSVRIGPTAKNPYTGVRWYEIRSPGTTPVVFQQSSFSPDTSFRWMGSIAMDRLGDMALGYSVSSAAMFPAIRYTGRLASDPPSTMQAETSIIEGTGSQSGNRLNRWGDYSAMTIDPVDDCTFWYTSEYLQTTGSFNWSTRIGSFTFPSCAISGPATAISFTTQPNTGANIAAGANIPLVVHVVDTNNLPVANDSIGLSIASGPFGATLSGTTTVSTDASGNATFNASLNTVGSYTLMATETTAALTVTSNQFNIVAGAPASIIFSSQPGPGASYAAGTTLAAAATVQDGFGNPVLGDNITLSIGVNPGGSALSVTTNPVATDNTGTATFAGVSLDKVGTNYQLQVTDSSATPLTALSNAFNIIPGAPTLVFTTQPTDVTAGNVLNTIVVTEQDSLGNVISDTASVDFTVPACAGSVDLGSVAMVGGVATLSPTQRFYTAPASLQVTATSGTLSAFSSSFGVLANIDLLFSDGFDGCRL